MSPFKFSPPRQITLELTDFSKFRQRIFACSCCTCDVLEILSGAWKMGGGWVREGEGGRLNVLNFPENKGICLRSWKMIFVIVELIVYLAASPFGPCNVCIPEVVFISI